MYKSSILIEKGKLPFFAEYAHYLWGIVNYDSEGNCEKPTDRQWTYLYVENRANQEFIEIFISNENCFEIEGNNKDIVNKSIKLTEYRRDNNFVKTFDEFKLADEIHEMFINPKLAIFDKMRWWCGWKWNKLYCTDFSYTFRYIMNAVENSLNNPKVIKYLKEHIYSGIDKELKEDLIQALKLIRAK